MSDNYLTILFACNRHSLYPGARLTAEPLNLIASDDVVKLTDENIYSMDKIINCQRKLKDQNKNIRRVIKSHTKFKFKL